MLNCYAFIFHLFVVLFVVAVDVVVRSTLSNTGGLDPGLVGLILSYTSMLTGLLNWGVRRFSEAELGLVAVER